jgi:1-acyl-sn-glycerol-3-phosphate acyltransferase
MAKPPALGNDPFQRTAAPREPLEPSPARAPDSQGGAPSSAEPSADASAGAAARGSEAVRRAPSRRSRRAPAEPSTPPGRESEAPPSARRASKRRAQAKASKPAEPPPPAVQEAARVLEGEVVAEGATRDRELALARVEEAAPRPPPAGAEEEGPGSLLRRAFGAASAIALSARALAAGNSVAQRASQALHELPLAQRMIVAAADAVQAARPAFALAERLLPPARAMLSSVMSGEAARELASAAAAAGEAARRAVTRVEPGVLEVDPFGEDPALLSRVEPLLDFLHEHYFRIQVFGAEHVGSGPCVLVANHSGALPLDGLMLRTVLRRDCGRPDARWLVEDALFHAPFVGIWLSRLGAIRACPENAERLLEQGVALAVFPEGVLGISKPLARRYQLQRFGRGGFVKLALRTGAPIVPAAVVGAEEASPLLAKIPLRSLGLPYLPLTPPPLPIPWKISFLEPVHLPRGSEAEQPEFIAHHTAQIRQAIQHEVNRLRGLSPR